MSMIKYRIHEVAKDFNVPSKVINQILTDYVAAPKNHMQVLENNELDVIFDYMTQHNQVGSLEEIFNAAPKAESPKAAPAPKAESGKRPRQSPPSLPRNPQPMLLPLPPQSRLRLQRRKTSPMCPARWRRSA